MKKIKRVLIHPLSEACVSLPGLLIMINISSCGKIEDDDDFLSQN